MAKSLVSVFRQVIENYMETFETALPALIDSINDDGTANVVPSVRNCLANMQLQNGGGDLEAIPGVPILWPGTASAIVKFELQKGDPVLLVSCSRDLAAWTGGAWEKAPFDPLSFDGNDLNDLVALPLRRPDGPAPKLTIKIKADGTAEVTATKFTFSGNMKIKGDLEVGGGMNAGGSIEAGGDVSTPSASLNTHTHTALLVTAGKDQAKTTPPDVI